MLASVDQHLPTFSHVQNAFSAKDSLAYLNTKTKCVQIKKRGKGIYDDKVRCRGSFVSVTLQNKNPSSVSAPFA